MVKIKPLRRDLASFLKKRNLWKKFKKQSQFFEKDINHPSLHTEILEPKKYKIFSFRIDRKYRAIFIYRNDEVEIVDVNSHYE
jgi:plasmid maintenance system killer protein